MRDLDGTLGRVMVDGCATCGAAIEQPATGRRRRYCSGRCRMEACRRRQGVRPMVRRKPPPPRAEVCVSCGAAIDQPAQGRARRYCGPGCRRNACQDRLGRPARHIPDQVRDRVVERDSARCHMCGVVCEPGHPDPARRLTIDHLVPISRGGDSDPANLAVACQSCNSRRGPGRVAVQLAIIG